LPPVLHFVLNRFALDYETFERKKLNDKFEFPLEINMSKYVSPELIENSKEDDLIYELKSIINHSGGAGGGHYYAYIKDDLGVGNWHVENPDQYEDKTKCDFPLEFSDTRLVKEWY